jgi:hypothetical protein
VEKLKPIPEASMHPLKLVFLLFNSANLNLHWQASMGVVAVGTVFPLVFAIQAAYASRNQTTKALGQLKVHST